MDAKAVSDGDTISVYVNTADPRESSCVPRDVQTAAVQRSKARSEGNYERADALHKKIIDSGYRLVIYLPLYEFGSSHCFVILVFLQGNQCSK